MLILTELDEHGHVVMEHGAAKMLNSANEFYDDHPVKSAENYLLAMMRGITASNPARNLAVVKVEYRIVHRNHEPVSPCGG